jgi:hypothetical protein
MARGPLRKRESNLWARDPLDWYVEPDWCSDRLFQIEQFEGLIWDCCAGTGRIAYAARQAGYTAEATDIVARSPGITQFDFLSMRPERPNAGLSIVCNPPYRLAREFAELALKVITYKAALFLPANWVQGEKRSTWLESTPLRRVLFVCPRPSCPPGDIIKQGVVPGNGTTDFAWFIWERGYADRPEIGWCRR